MIEYVRGEYMREGNTVAKPRTNDTYNILYKMAVIGVLDFELLTTFNLEKTGQINWSDRKGKPTRQSIHVCSEEE
jgi:hypothetical protein